VGPVPLAPHRPVAPFWKEQQGQCNTIKEKGMNYRFQYSGNEGLKFYLLTCLGAWCSKPENTCIRKVPKNKASLSGIFLLIFKRKVLLISSYALIVVSSKRKERRN
jgi:hypothetical protein